MSTTTVRPTLVSLSGGGSQLQFVVRPQIRNDGLDDVYVGLCGTLYSRIVQKLEDSGEWQTKIDASCLGTALTFTAIPIGGIVGDSVLVAVASGVPSPVQLAAIPRTYRVIYTIARTPPSTSAGSPALLPAAARMSNEFQLSF